MVNCEVPRTDLKKWDGRQFTRLLSQSVVAAVFGVLAYVMCYVVCLKTSMAGNQAVQIAFEPLAIVRTRSSWCHRAVFNLCYSFGCESEDVKFGMERFARNNPDILENATD